MLEDSFRIKGLERERLRNLSFLYRMEKYMIEIKQLYKSYGELEVLKDINLTVNTGEIYGLVGRSGAGKSTLLRCINGLENYQSGSLKIDGTEMKELSKTQLREFQKEIGITYGMLEI